MIILIDNRAVINMSTAEKTQADARKTADLPFLRAHCRNER